MNLNDAFTKMIRAYWDEEEGATPTQSKMKYDRKYFDTFEEEVNGKKAKEKPVLDGGKSSSAPKPKKGSYHNVS